MEKIISFLRKAGRIRSGLTLTEILVVIVIASILAALSFPAVRNARRRALAVKTQAIIASLEAALSMYCMDFGDYPASSGDSGLLVRLLQGPLESALWKGPYMRFRSADLDGQDNILDAWQTPISYKYPQDERPNIPYTLISAGADRRFGTGEDIGNW